MKQFRLLLALFGCTVLLISGVKFSNAFSSRHIYRQQYRNGNLQDSPSKDQNAGDPLILTPLIEAGRIDEARKLSQVTNLTGSHVKSHSGYFTTNPKYNSNMFFWFFPAVLNKEKAPVVVWLQGGPGGSSLFGLFVENGPFTVDVNNNLHPRGTSWSLTHSVIYFDNPVGTGFSFTDDDAGFARTENDVADGLYSALTQFFTMFPEYQTKDFYITGESYAGKYVPAITYRIHQENQKSPKVKMNLQGMAIGDGFSDPVNMLIYGDYLYSIGLIDDIQRDHFHQEEQRARDFIKTEQWPEAFTVIDELMDGDLTGHPSYFKNSTGFDFYFNYLMASEPPEQEYFSKFVQLDYVRQALHVGNRNFSDLGGKVELLLRGDMYQSVVPWIVELLDAPQKYKVLLYSGQLDIIVAHPLTENMIRLMTWHGAEDFSKAERKQWKVGKDIAGYVKVADNLTYLLVRNAGHMVPLDQPKWSFDMINRFTKGKKFESK